MKLLPELLDEGWWEITIKRAHAVYSNEGVRPTASLMARTGKFAIDYLEQAPAILAYVTWGVSTRTYADRALVAQLFGSAVRRGPKLKEIMAEFHAPLPIRKIRGNAVIPSNLSTILALRNVPPSVLSQAIPEESNLQLRWLRFLRHWLSTAGRYHFLAEHNSAWNWAVAAGSVAIRDGVPNVEGRVGDIFDFIIRGKNRLNPDWTFRAALAATERWHAELAAKQDHEKFLSQHGFRFDDQRDYAPLPETWTNGEYTATALRSGLELFLEGRAMRHCVASYVREVMLGGTRIYSIRKGEDRVATLELHPRGERFVPAQLKGPCNSHPKKAVQDVAAKFVQSANAGIKESASCT